VAGRLGLAPASTTQLEHLVLGHMGFDLRHLEDLAPLELDDLGSGQIGLASRAARRPVGDDLVGIGYLGQVMSWIPRLLARPALGLAPLGPVGRRWLLESFGRRRHRGVARIAPKTRLQFVDLLPQRRDGLSQLGVLGTQRSVLSLESSNLLTAFVGNPMPVALCHVHQCNRCARKSRALREHKRAGRANVSEKVAKPSGHPVTQHWSGLP
jgi:hypothetical protein